MRSTSVLILAAVFCGLSYSQTQPLAGGAPRIYIDPQSRLESYVAAAIVKKQVSAVVTHDQADARFVLSGTIDQKTESTGSKVARCLFLYCIGMEGVQTVTVNLVDVRTQEIIWAYTVKKASANAYQSTAEAVAKHLKHFLEERPQRF